MTITRNHLLKMATLNGLKDVQRVKKSDAPNLWGNVKLEGWYSVISQKYTYWGKTLPLAYRRLENLYILERQILLFPEV